MFKYPDIKSKLLSPFLDFASPMSQRHLNLTQGHVLDTRPEVGQVEQSHRSGSWLDYFVSQLFVLSATWIQIRLIEQRL